MLDSYALVAVARREPGAETTRAAIEDGGAVVSWINLGEVYYVLARERGLQRAQRFVRDAAHDARADLPSVDLVLAAARLRVRGRIAYPDCFAVATAQHESAPLLTGDPEILALADQVQVVDLRHAP